MLQLKIPVPTYLKKFLTKSYGDDYKVSFNDEIGVLILNTLKNKSVYHEITLSKNQREYDTDYFCVEISLSNFDKYGCHITQKDLILLRKSLDNLFRNQMFRTGVMNQSLMNIPFKNTFEMYLKTYGITEDDLSYSTIRRDFNRKKNAIAKRLDLV